MPLPVVNLNATLRGIQDELGPKIVRITSRVGIVVGGCVRPVIENRNVAELI